MEGKTHLVRIYYGGGVWCDCERFRYERDCRHAAEAWQSLTPFQREVVLRHDEVVEKLKNYAKR